MLTKGYKLECKTFTVKTVKHFLKDRSLGLSSLLFNVSIVLSFATNQDFILFKACSVDLGHDEDLCLTVVRQDEV